MVEPNLLSSLKINRDLLDTSFSRYIIKNEKILVKKLDLYKDGKRLFSFIIFFK